MPTPTFYFDLGSPYAWLSAERVESAFAATGGVRWQPVLLGGLFRANGRSSWARASEASRRKGVEEVEARAAAQGLAQVCWPDGWPSDYLGAMRAATFAFQHDAGLGRRFALAAFRSAFTRGEDLSRPDCVLAAGEKVGIAPAELEAAIGDERVKLALRRATEDAHARGAIGVPSFAVGANVLWGDDRLEQACRLAAASPTQLPG